LDISKKKIKQISDAIQNNRKNLSKQRSNVRDAAGDNASKVQLTITHNNQDNQSI